MTDQSAIHCSPNKRAAQPFTHTPPPESGPLKSAPQMFHLIDMCAPGRKPLDIHAVYLLPIVSIITPQDRET